MALALFRCGLLSRLRPIGCCAGARHSTYIPYIHCYIHVYMPRQMPNTVKDVVDNEMSKPLML
jgi:hypothetical protein